MNVGRPKRPLDPVAVKAANEKLWAKFPHLKGRQLTLDDEYKIRHFWREAYDGEIDKKTCPKKAVTGAAVTRCSEMHTTTPLTKTEWQDKAIEAAGINGNDWIADKGFEHNRETVKKVYAYYAKLYSEDHNLLWAGMAKLAGGAVYGGLETSLKAKTVAAAGRALPFPLGTAAEVAHGEAEFVENKMVQMQKDIFSDMAWQHQAYKERGICEMEAAYKRGEITLSNLEAWRDIASRDPNRVSLGNTTLLRREQYDVLDHSYKEISGGLLGSSRATAITKMAESPIPGGKPFSQVVPDGDVTNFADRWKWIETDMLPKYNQLTPEERTALVNESLEDLAARNFAAGPK